MTPAWASVALMAIGMATGVFLALDTWVHGRSTTESSLARDVEDLGKRLAVTDALANQIGEMRLQLARIEEHFRSTDRDVVTLRTDVDSLRRWMVTRHE